MELWLPKERKVLLSQFLDSTMAQDVDPTGKDSFVKDYWRKKTYAKDADKLLPFAERDFSEPYMVAQHTCGGTWNDYNQPFIVQVAQCNLACRWCFVPCQLRNASNGHYFSAEGIVTLYRYHTESHGILRISGGEPFLAPEFLMDIGKEMTKITKNAHYLWIDTNLCGTKYEEVISMLDRCGIPFGICGCFKGFDVRTFGMNMEDWFVHSRDVESRFDTQFSNARQILEALHKSYDHRGELFFYVPEVVYPDPDNFDILLTSRVSSFIHRLSTEVHPNAPLRTTVLTIKAYDSNKNTIPSNRIETGLTRRVWNDLIAEKYPLDLRWLPQYQVPMHLKKEEKQL